jgi:hypothetical protein
MLSPPPSLPAIKVGFGAEAALGGSQWVGMQKFEVICRRGREPCALTRRGAEVLLRWVPHTRMFTRLQGSQESGINSHSFQA